MQRDSKQIRILTDAYPVEGGPSGIGIVAVNAPPNRISRISEQAFGSAQGLHFRAILEALELAADLGARGVVVYCPDPPTVRLVNREIPLSPGSPLVPLYVRIRALMHSFPDAKVRCVARSRVKFARRLAMEAISRPVRSADPQGDLFAAVG